MQRREFIDTLAGGAVAAALPARLLAAEKIYRIGFLGGNSGGPTVTGFAKGLEDLGYFDGKNIKIEWRLDNGHPDLLPDMAAELVRLNVDIIVTVSSTGGLVAQNATNLIPIVVMASHNGVGSGLYKSLAHPGGNITGNDSVSPLLDVKRVEMLKDILPQLSSLTAFHNPTFPGAKVHSDEIVSTAEKLNIALRFVEVRAISDFDSAFAAILRDRPDAVITVADPMIFGRRKQIIDFGNERRVPMIHESKVFVTDGALVAYGPDLFEFARQGASYVDKILKGQKAGDLPVEQPTKFDLALNLKTAKALGITIPSNLIVSANVVIE